MVDAQDPLTRLAEAMDVAQQAVDGVRTEHWSAPSPCQDWTVEHLVRHLVEGNEALAASLSSDAGPVVDTGSGRSASWADRHRVAAAAVVAALRQPGVLEQPITVPAGTVPGGVVVGLRTVEALVHGWDIAASTGQPLHAPDDLVEHAERLTRQLLERMPADRKPFKDPTTPPPGATPLDRLAALLGRDVPAAG